MISPKLSIVIPFFNEENNLEELQRELSKVLKNFKQDFEIIYINDGSTDSSVEKLSVSLLKDQKKDRLNAKLISLRRNYGQTSAIAAGIDASSGQYIVFLDADLQNDPEDIPRLISKLNPDVDAVIGWRRNRRDDLPRSLASKTANFLINLFFNVPFHDCGCALKVVKKDALSEIQLFGEAHRLLPVLLHLKGLNVVETTVNHRHRHSGESKYGFERIIKLLVDLTTIKFLNSYETKPAYIFGGFGFINISVAIAVLFYVAYEKIVLGIFVHRNPLFLIASFMILLGVQFILMGLLAEFFVRTYFDSQHKKIYEIRKVSKF